MRKILYDFICANLQEDEDAGLSTFDRLFKEFKENYNPKAVKRRKQLDALINILSGFEENNVDLEPSYIIQYMLDNDELPRGLWLSEAVEDNSPRWLAKNTLPNP